MMIFSPGGPSPRPDIEAFRRACARSRWMRSRAKLNPSAKRDVRGICPYCNSGLIEVVFGTEVRDSANPLDRPFSFRVGHYKDCSALVSGEDSKTQARNLRNVLDRQIRRLP